MKLLLVGGSGRSGTSAIVERLRVWPEVGNLLDAELKIFSEADGLPDLYWNFVKAFSPQRSIFALQRFGILFNALLDDSPGAIGVRNYLEPERWRAILESFNRHFLLGENIAKPISESEFFAAVAELVTNLGDVVQPTDAAEKPIQVFMEKTPHNLLQMRIWQKLPLETYFLHVMRDPRIVANSLLKMPWGPTTLESCCLWVRSYADTFSNLISEGYGERENVMLTYIEDYAIEKENHARMIASWLGVNCVDSIFFDIATESLNYSVASIGDADAELLQKHLKETAISLGYNPTEFGVRS